MVPQADEVGVEIGTLREPIPLRRFLLAAALVVLNFLDVVMTRWIISLGGHEANPIMRPVMGSGVSAMVVKLGLALAIGGLAVLSPPRSRWVDRAMGLVVVVYAVVVGWNLANLVHALELSRF